MKKQERSRLDRRIEKFINRHHVMTLATIDESGMPWCSNIFYAFIAETAELVFTSGVTTAHARHAADRPTMAAASILLESKVVGKLQGVQLRGTLTQAEESRYKKAFLGAFPIRRIFAKRDVGYEDQLRKIHG